MLTRSELEDALATLRQAEVLISGVRATFFASGDIYAARLLNEIVNLLADEIAASQRTLQAMQK